VTSVHWLITTCLAGEPEGLPAASIFFTMSSPFRTLPKTTCLPSSQEVEVVVMKNYDPLVFGPALAIDKHNGSW